MSDALHDNLLLANTGIEKFGQVSPCLYRGGQPDREQILALAQAGIKTIVTFRWDAAAIRQERTWVREAGMNYMVIPLTYFVLPTRKEIARFLEICDEPSMQPVFVHCKHGVDRTGAMIAIWRVAKENWSADKAYAEMRDLGFHKIRVHHFKFSVYDFAERLERQRKFNE
jgi:protein tyrosine phosphatase (PTP) superfamily phosphohydrolase (DUF442 family)